MDRWLPVIATVAAGALVALQAPINSMLGRTVGNFAASAVSFLIGLAVLIAIVLLTSGFGKVPEAGGLPWYYLLGGVLGAVYVTTVLITVRSLGAGGLTAATIAGQLTASVAIDKFGVLGVEGRGFTPGRVAGIALLAMGVFLIVRE